MKRLQLLSVILLTVFFSYTVVAQESGTIKKGFAFSFPEKIQKLVLDPLPAGTYSVGTGGDFPTIDSVFNKLSIDGIAGEVILELIDDLYNAPSGQYGYVLNGPIPGAGPNSRVTIKPAENKNVTIQGNNLGLLNLINSSYVTFDGVGVTGSTTLTINALQNASYVYNDAIDFNNNSDHNIIQNITFIVDDYLRPSAGIWFSGSAPDSNLIQYNAVKKAGIFLSITTGGNGNIIRGNQIGSETDSLVAYGIEVVNCEGTLIENNLIQNMKVTVSGSNQAQVGIALDGGNNQIIRNNVVRNCLSISGYITAGIYAGVGGTNNQVYNNMVYGIHSTSIQSNSRLAGIYLAYQTNPKIYYNSVYLLGSGAIPLGSAALYIYTNSTNVDAKNNIFINTRDESPYYASAIYDYSASNLTSDYNDLYANNYLVRIGSTNYNTLADWQATGKDLNSITEMPNFIAPYLHIDETIGTYLESGATPIAGIDSDFDGELRNVSTPDIGADEFDGFTLEDPLPAGTYTIGTSGNFATIQDAFNKLSIDGIAGEVTLELIDNLYTAPTDSFGFKLVGPISGAAPNSRVTVKPAENKNVTIEGNGQNVLFFMNTSYVTLDGVDLSGATTLTVHSITNTQFDKNNAVGVYENSDYNEIKNLVVSVEDYLRNSRGIFVAGGTNPQSVPDGNLIMHNFIKKAGVAIYVRVTSGSIIRGNNIGSETDSLISWGIQSEVNINTLIEENHVQNLRFGIFNECPGIDSYVDNGCVIRNNVVHNIDGRNAVDGGFGIELSGDSGNPGINNMVYNNMVYDIRSSSNRASGIQLWYVNNSKIYYNTVYLFGNGTGTTTNGSAALYISHSCTNVEVKNNILVNTRDESPYFASAIYDYTTSNLTSDYNDLYSANNLVRIGSTNYNTLADWQVTGNDIYSYVEMPPFISSTDLHIDETIATYLESRGIPITGIDTDFDGDQRNADSTDIGADEFNGIYIPTGIEDEIRIPTEFALEQNYPNPFNPSTTFRYSIPTQSKVTIKVYDILGNEIATLMDEEKSVGIYELMWTSANLPSGVYFYQLRAGDFIQTKKMLLLK